MNDIKDPYIEIYEHIFNLSKALGYTTFDHLPSDDIKYPLVFIGEQFANDIRTKTLTRGSTNIIIHIYSWETQRRAVNTMMAFLNRAINNINLTDNFKWTITDNQIHYLYENDEVNPLMHGILDVNFEFTGKGE